MNSTRRLRHPLGLACLLALPALMLGCKDDTSSPDVAQDPNQPTAPTPIVTEACGTLTPQAAADIAVHNFDLLARGVLASLRPIEGSRTLARLLSFGYEKNVSSFVDDALADLSKTEQDLRDSLIAPTHIETTDASSVTFISAPDAGCPNSGSAYDQVEQDECLAYNKLHPVRTKLSRVACDRGDNLRIQVMMDPDKLVVLDGNLFADHAAANVEFGAFLSRITTKSTSSSAGSGGSGSGVPTVTITRGRLVDSASGKLSASLNLTGAASVNALVALTDALDVAWSNNGVKEASQLHVAPSPRLISASADAGASLLNFGFNAQNPRIQLFFEDFVETMFNLQVTDGPDRVNKVDMNVSAFSGQAKYTKATDSIDVEHLSLGPTTSKATLGTADLLTVDVNPDNGREVTLKALANDKDTISVQVPSGFDLQIGYHMQSVFSQLVGPAKFIADDKVSIRTSADARLELLLDRHDYFALTSGAQGSLTRVEAGTVDLASQLVPDAAVHVAATQCLNRDSSVQKTHDFLEEMSVGPCLAVIPAPSPTPVPIGGGPLVPAGRIPSLPLPRL